MQVLFNTNHDSDTDALIFPYMLAFYVLVRFYSMAIGSRCVYKSSDQSFPLLKVF